MPRPLYIICAHEGALDQYTNAISLFGVVEYIRSREVQPQPDGTFVLPPLSLRVVAAWARGDQDGSGDWFESQLAVFMEGLEEEAYSTDFPEFRFEAPVHRLIVPKLVIPPNIEIPPGLLRFRCRLRQKGKAAWQWHQDCAILVESDPEEAATPQAPPPAQPADGSA
jgi:hypothetical protein